VTEEATIGMPRPKPEPTEKELLEEILARVTKIEDRMDRVYIIIRREL
jgi:hypothetical protein